MTDFRKGAFFQSSIYNPSQNIWHKLKKYNKIGQDFKNVISNFACFWQLLSISNFWKEGWPIGCISTQSWHFSNISKFPKIPSLKLFVNSWDNSCTKFVMLDIKYRFTGGDLDLREIIKKCQNIMTRFVWKLYFALYSSNNESPFWKKYQFWFKKY